MENLSFWLTLRRWYSITQLKVLTKKVSLVLFKYLLVTFDLQEGYHDFLWSYKKYVNNDNNKLLKVVIKSIEINGIEFAAYECKDCVNSFSLPGSSECHFCKSNTYFDKTQVKFDYY